MFFRSLETNVCNCVIMNPSFYEIAGSMSIVQYNKVERKIIRVLRITRYRTPDKIVDLPSHQFLGFLTSIYLDPEIEPLISQRRSVGRFYPIGPQRAPREPPASPHRYVESPIEPRLIDLYRDLRRLQWLQKPNYCHTRKTTAIRLYLSEKLPPLGIIRTPGNPQTLTTLSY